MRRLRCATSVPHSQRLRRACHSRNDVLKRCPDIPDASASPRESPHGCQASLCSVMHVTSSTYDISPSGVVYGTQMWMRSYQAALASGQARSSPTGPCIRRPRRTSAGRPRPLLRARQDAPLPWQDHDELIAWGDPSRRIRQPAHCARSLRAALGAGQGAPLSRWGPLRRRCGSGRTDVSRLMVRVITSRPTSALFARNIFVPPSDTPRA